MRNRAISAVLVLAAVACSAADSTTTTPDVAVDFSSVNQNIEFQIVVVSSGGTVNEGSATFSVMDGLATIGTAVSSPVSNGLATGTYVLPGGTNAGTYLIVATYTGAGNFDNSGGIGNLTVNTVATIVAVANAQTPYSTTSHDVTLSATISSGLGQVNSGTVLFSVKSGSQLIGNSVVVAASGGGASASYTLPAGLPVNTYGIEVQYSGDGEIAGGFGTGTLTVQSTGASSPTVTAATNEQILFSASDRPVTLHATVTSQPVNPNEGTITFVVKAGSTVTGSAVTVPVAGGQASGDYVIRGGTPVGTYSIVASYNGTSNFDGSSSTATLSINAVPSETDTLVPSLQVNFSANPQTVTLHADIPSDQAVNQGTVAFVVRDGATQIGSTVSGNVAQSAADAQFTIPAGTAAKSYVIHADYSGGASFLSSSGTGFLDVQVIIAPTTTTTPNVQTDFSVNTQDIVVRATVSSPGQTVNQETVTFSVRDGGTLIGTPSIANVINGEAGTFYTLPAGLEAKNYSILAVYKGGANFSSSNGTATLSVLSVNGENPTVTIVNDAQSNFNANEQPVSLHATVTSPSSSVNEGIVTFTVRDGATVIGFPVTGSVTAGNATAVFTVPAGLAAKNYALAAEFSGGINFNPSFAFANFTVNPAGGEKSPSNVGVQNASVSSKPANQNVPLQASISSPGGTVNEGILSFKVKDGATQIGGTLSVAVVNGSASGNFLLPGGTPANNYTIEASYGGGTHFEPSSATGTLTVQPQGSTSPTTTLVGNVSIVVSDVDQFANLSATINSAGGTPNEGTVVFSVRDGAGTIGTPITVNVSDGSASGTYTIPANTPVKNYIIRANYSGGPQFDSSNGAGTLSILAHPANQSPAFISGPTATPAAPFVGQTVSFTLSASDPEGDSISASWDFGDSSTASGFATTHVFAAAGTYSVVAKLIDSRDASASATVLVVVSDAIYGNGPDTDGDGFSDSFEQAAQSNPNLATSTPFGTNAAVEPLLLTIKSLAIKLDFIKPAADSVTLAGSLPVPGNFSFNNKKVVVDIGGFVTPFTLDSKGKSTPKSNKTFAIAKPKSGIAAFTCKMSKIDIDAFLVDEGLVPTAPKDKRVSITVTVLFNNAGYRKNQTLIFNQSKGAKGTTKPG